MLLASGLQLRLLSLLLQTLPAGHNNSLLLKFLASLAFSGILFGDISIGVRVVAERSTIILHGVEVVKRYVFAVQVILEGNPVIVLVVAPAVTPVLPAHGALHGARDGLVEDDSAEDGAA